jgi:hypothetical protein
MIQESINYNGKIPKYQIGKTFFLQVSTGNNKFFHSTDLIFKRF